MIDLNIDNLRNKVHNYNSVFENTIKYREVWKDSLKEQIIRDVRELSEEVKLKLEIETTDTFHNLETIICSLGNVKSGIYEMVEPDIEKHLIRFNGSLVYQQLYNGKVLVMINYPIIESYMEPRPPKTIAIYRPEEIKTPFILRHLETLVSEITAWEDYDDDETVLPSRIGFNHTPNMDLSQTATHENQEDK
ncbi:MAG: hypothetical protein J5I59_03820 [Saprospiraceae bacterium]|nr:hypothetical protein [Saprospiraceae bacterium]